MNNPILSKYISFSLKVIGIICILSSLVDNLASAIPFKKDAFWQYDLVNSVTARGLVTLIGIIFFLVGYWINENEVEPEQQQLRRKFGLRLPVLLLCSILGLMFLLLIPLHIKNTLTIVDNRNTQISKEAKGVEKKLQEKYDQNNQIATALSQKPEKIKELEEVIKNIDQALAKGELQGKKLNEQQKQELIQRKNQYQFLQQLATVPNLPETTLNRDQLNLKEKVKEEQGKNNGIYKQCLRIILNLILLSIGYIAIGWTGLRTTENWQFKWLGKLMARKKSENELAKARAKARPKAKVQEAQPPKTPAKRVVRPQAKAAAPKTSAKRGARPQNQGGWFNKINPGKQGSKAKTNQPEDKLNLIEPELEAENQNLMDVSTPEVNLDSQENNEQKH